MSTTGAITNWPEFAHTMDSFGATETWSYGTGKNRRGFSLQLTGIRPGTASSSDVIQFLSDYSLTLSTTFAAPVLCVSSTGEVSWMTNAMVFLTPSCPVPLDYPLYSIGVTKGSRRASGLFYTIPPSSSIRILTLPALQWVVGSISGFTAQPVYVDSYYALTFQPEHHNWNNHFIVDPSVEPALSAAQRAELVSQNIRLLYGYTRSSGPNRLFVLGFDNTVREVQ